MVVVVITENCDLCRRVFMDSSQFVPGQTDLPKKIMQRLKEKLALKLCYYKDKYLLI